MAASSLNLKQLPLLPHTTSLRRPMAASSFNLKRLPRLLNTSTLRPMTLRATSRFFSTDSERTFYATFHAEREPKPTIENPSLPPFVHHKIKLGAREDGFEICLYMAGVSKENVKVWTEHDEMIVQGKMVNDFEDEDDVMIGYRMSRPPTDVFDLDATKAEINNGILKVFVPKKY